MDDTDRKLLCLIVANPRMHLQEIAKSLGISKQAVHRRLNALTEIGVIQEMTAGISFPYVDAVPVAVFGRARTAPSEKTLDRLGGSEFTHRVVVAGGNYVYVVGELRDLSELDGYSEFVKQAAEMSEPNIGVYSLDDGLWSNYPVDGIVKRKQSYKELSPLDLRIIASLKDDARRPIVDIAHMVGASTKTVRTHLENMLSEGSLELHTRMDPYLGGDACLLGHVSLRDGASKAEVGRRLLSKHPFQDAYIRTFVNIPGLLMLVFWSDKMAEIREVLRMIDDDEDVSTVMLNFSYLQRMYTTWRDKLPEVSTPRSSKAGTHTHRSRLRTQQF